MGNRAGYYKTNLSGEMAYKSFVPNALPPVSPIEIPPSPEDMVEAMSELEKYMNVDDVW